MLSPLVLLALAGGAAFFLTKKSGPTGPAKPVSVTGKSGTVWTVQRTSVVKGEAFYQIMIGGRRIATYKQSLKGHKRIYVRSPKGVRQSELMKAISDFRLVAPSVLVKKLKRVKKRTRAIPLPAPKRRVRKR